MANPPKPNLKPLPTIKRQPRPIFPDLISGHDLDQIIFPELEWAIPGIIPEGSTLLVGPPKAGKSWLILGLALSVASGNPALSVIGIPSPRPVLMLALEDGRRRFQSRCRTILGPGEPLPELLDVVTQVEFKSLFDDIDRWLEQNAELKPLVVLDTLGKVMPPAVAGESSYQRDYRIGSQIKYLCGQYPGSSFVSIHHDRKAESVDFVDAVSGTHGLAGAADTIILLERDRQQSDGVLHVTGRDVDEAEYAIINDNGRWQLNGNSLEAASTQSAAQHSKANLGDKSKEIIDFIGNNQPVTHADVLKEFGSNARVYLHRLTESNRIVRVGRGKYELPRSIPIMRRGSSG